MKPGRVLLPALLAPAALVAAGCGGGGYCGDGELDMGEQCDDNNDDETDSCRSCYVYIPPRTVVYWTFNVDDQAFAMGDSCNDLGVSTVRVDLAGPVSVTGEETCPGRQVVFQDLPAGTYAATMTPLDFDGASLVSSSVEGQLTTGPDGAELTMNVPWQQWLRDYTGTFYFRLRWNGADCSGATPPVTTQILRLVAGGAVSTQVTDNGQRLDGTDPKPCRAASDQFPQSALAVPFGPATFEVIGRDLGGEERYRQTFETFVGAGVINPEQPFDLSLTADAGVADADQAADAM